MTNALVKFTDPVSRARLNAAARKFTAAWEREELARIEVGYVAEAAWRSEYAQRNVARWTAIRRARGAGK
jgi:hypothetical protein